MKRILLLSLLAALPAFAQTQPTVLYGASYYHEYMPSERLDQDIALMKQAGLTVVRMGESTWTSWEPRDGQFEFAWMDRIVDRMHAAGIRVILGTPTYSVPPWLFKKHPEVMLTHLDGRRAPYGGRQNMNISHPAYRYYAERVIRQIAAHYKDHPAVIGWQIDNETSHYYSAGPSVQADFVEYLKKKFGVTQELNKVWGLVYWGQLVQDWDELPPRDGILNPGYKLEWERHQQIRATDFLAWQARIINEYKRRDQFVTQDFSGKVHTDIDQWAISRHLDIVGTNPYYDVQDDLDGHSATLTGDLARSLKNTNFLVTETNAQTTGWDAKGQFPPYDGQLRLNVYNHIADGANMVAYWHWHSLHYGQETYWKGILSHDLQPNRIYAEFAQVAAELKRHGTRLVNFQRRNDVAILYSIDSAHGISFMPISNTVDYISVLRQMHRALYDLNIGVDLITPDTKDLSRYRVILVPPLYVASDTTLNKLADYARDGGHLLLTFKSGFTNEYDTVRATLAPGPLREAAGLHYQEFSSLKAPLALKGDPFQAGPENKAHTWIDMVILDTAKPLAQYDHPFFAQFPAITRNTFGRGTVTYQGSALSDTLQRALILDVAKLANLATADQQLPAGVKVKHGTLNTGHRAHYYLNFTGRPQTFTYPYAAATGILNGQAHDRGATLTLQPWNLAILEER